MGTTIRGYSDDTIDFSGDVSGEVGCYDKDVLIVCSDGTVLEAKYGTLGIWNFRKIRTGDLFSRIVECGDGDEGGSDTVEFDGGLKWAFASKQWERVS